LLQSHFLDGVSLFVVVVVVLEIVLEIVVGLAVFR
jgi:hypothetical protein